METVDPWAGKRPQPLAGAHSARVEGTGLGRALVLEAGPRSGWCPGVGGGAALRVVPWCWRRGRARGGALVLEAGSRAVAEWTVVVWVDLSVFVACLDL
ncbi:hypothetical protein chiPu_0016228 [Chiloscyllium punctatum]|uniref:Uncharacterized protein n=1 Tax=Chiloscyllium punctatum TaxID=137246 RepID=A0A401T524_CHIPU|nr:hypothetical protein [Chiloscyllium punctatum]